MPRKPTARTLDFIPGTGGWARVAWRQGQPGEVVAYVRFSVEQPALTLTVAELRFTEPWVRRHRELPLSRVENAANADANTRAHIHMDSKEDAPPDLDEYFAAKAKTSGRRVQPRHRLERPRTPAARRRLLRSRRPRLRGSGGRRVEPAQDARHRFRHAADTVARWIAEARRRGHLSPGELGKASGTTYTKAGTGKAGA